MNLGNVLRTYALLRQLSDDESALLATLRGMSDTERELLVESLQPEKVGGKKQPDDKKCRHELPDGQRCGKSQKHLIHSENSDHALAHEFILRAKSQRASNMAATLGNRNRQSQEPRCVACYEVLEHANHGSSEGQHQFETSISERAIRQLKKHELCAHVFTDDGNRICDERADSAVHSDRVYTTYHEFVAPSAKAASGD